MPLFSTKGQTNLIATQSVITAHMYSTHRDLRAYVTYIKHTYEAWNFNSGNYLFTTDTK